MITSVIIIYLYTSYIKSAMLKCQGCPKYHLQYELDCIEDDIFLDKYQMNHDGLYVIPYDSLRKIIHTHVHEDMKEPDITQLVNEYGVFKAIKIYKDESGDFNPDDDLTFMKTFGTLAFHILYTHIRDNDIIIEEKI